MNGLKNLINRLCCTRIGKCYSRKWALTTPALLYGVRLPGGLAGREVWVLDVGAVLADGAGRHDEDAAHAEAGHVHSV